MTHWAPRVSSLIKEASAPAGSQWWALTADWTETWSDPCGTCSPDGHACPRCRTSGTCRRSRRISPWKVWERRPGEPQRPWSTRTQHGPQRTWPVSWHFDPWPFKEAPPLPDFGCRGWSLFRLGLSTLVLIGCSWRETNKQASLAAASHPNIVFSASHAMRHSINYSSVSKSWPIIFIFYGWQYLRRAGQPHNLCTETYFYLI